MEQCLRAQQFITLLLYLSEICIYLWYGHYVWPYTDAIY